jgi:tRNA (guanine26-N2/guanine27-N2)-dimethyltransferase
LSAIQDHVGRELVEGKARIQLPAPHGAVFYNPKMSLNRDIAILFVSSYSGPAERWRVCDPMTGSGVRAVRYVLETSNVDSVLAADRGHDAALLAQRNAQLNAAEERITVVCEDANRMLARQSNDRFGLIDLDPFGSPAPFFESALRATIAGGVIAATATDMGPLSGARPTACFRKYGVSPLRTEFEKEMALRALASCLAATAARLELGVEIVFSHATDHYARLYARVGKGRKEANLSLHNLGYVSYCSGCLFRSAANAMASTATKCPNCSTPTHIGGPYWLGPIWDRGTVESMVRHSATLASSRLSEVQRILDLVEGELHCSSFYYSTDSLASAYHAKPPSLSRLIESLRDAGFQATRTHFDPSGFRTTAPLPTIAATLLTVPQKSQPEKV